MNRIKLLHLLKYVMLTAEEMKLVNSTNSMVGTPKSQISHVGKLMMREMSLDPWIP